MVKISQTHYFEYISDMSNMLPYIPSSKVMEYYSDMIQFQLNHSYILEELTSVDYLIDSLIRLNKIIIYVEYRLNIQETPICIYNTMSYDEIINEFIPYIYFHESHTQEYTLLRSKLLNIIQIITPPSKWKIPVIILIGIFMGLGMFAFYLSNAPSYLSDDPKTCLNCHIMAPQYATWFHSSHREHATCNDCHVPNDNIFKHYFFKAQDGLRHATIFTLRKEPQVIMIKEAGQNAVQGNCLRCHANLIKDSKLIAHGNTYQKTREERQCWTCHRETPHGRVHSLASTPYARVPLLKSPVPQWLTNFVK